MTEHADASTVESLESHRATAESLTDTELELKVREFNQTATRDMVMGLMDGYTNATEAPYSAEDVMDAEKILRRWDSDEITDSERVAACEWAVSVIQNA